MSDAGFMAELCAAVALCASGTTCQPFNYYYLTVPYSSPTDDTMDIILNFQHPSAASYTVRYARIDNTNSPTYITIPNVLASPYTISGVDDGQYSVFIKPVYSDGRNCPETNQVTPTCAPISSFSAILGGSPIDEFVISYSAPSSAPKVRVNIAYPNGGSSSQIYTNDGTDITIPFPTSVYGSFSITIQTVCNEDTGFFGQPTAPIVLQVNDPSSSGGGLTATLTFSFVNISSGSYLSFDASLNRTIDANVNVSSMFANGFSDSGCTTNVATAQKGGAIINAGFSGFSVVPDSTTGSWATAIKYSEYNVVVNGSPVVDGSSITIGSYTVLISINTCA